MAIEATPIQTAFNAGELSDLIDGRVDFEKRGTGCRRLENFLPTVEGPIMRRPGSLYMGGTRYNDKRSFFVRFEFSVSQAFLLEFGDLYVRFWTHRAQLLRDFAPYTIISPYLVADLLTDDGCFALKSAQSGDVIYIAGIGKYPPQKLIRRGNTNWAFEEYKPDDGPFDTPNDENGATVLASDIEGSITLTADRALWTPLHVGMLMRIEPRDLDVKPWEVAKSMVAGELRRSDGKTYEALNSAKTGTIKPIHESGAAFDGSGIDSTNAAVGVNWQYRDPGYGVVRIVSHIDAQTVMAQVIKRLPVGLSTSATWRWRIGAWGRAGEWPRAVAFDSGRLVWAGAQRVWGSVAGDFDSQAPDEFNQILPDSAYSITVSEADGNLTNWLQSTGVGLMVGTTVGEFLVTPNRVSEPLGPTNFRVAQQSSLRSRSLSPVSAGSRLIMVQRAGRKVYELRYSPDEGPMVGVNLTRLQRYVTKSGITAISYQREPNGIVYCVRGDGRLVAFTYEPNENVFGWHQHPMPGAWVEDVANMPSPDGGKDDVWLIVRRVINGLPVRYVEMFADTLDEGVPREIAVHADAALVRASGAPVSVVSNLEHLEGETVGVLVDGAGHPDRVVAGAQITLAVPAVAYVVGKRFSSTMETMRLEAGTGRGTGQGKIKHVVRAVVRFLSTLGAKAKAGKGAFIEVAHRSPAVPMGQAPPLFDGDFPVTFDAGHDTDARVTVMQDTMLPCTVVAVIPDLVVYED